MMEHLNSEEVENMSANTLRNFARSVFTVTKKIEERKSAREALEKHLKKIKKEAGATKTKKDALKKHLAELENKVQEVIIKELKLLRGQEYENKTIQELKKRIEQLEKQLSIRNQENQNLTRTNTERIQSVQDSINTLRGQLKSYIQERTQREQKVNELENKIKNKIPYKKDQLRDLEKKFVKLKEEKPESDVLTKIYERIKMLKERKTS